MPQELREGLELLIRMRGKEQKLFRDRAVIGRKRVQKWPDSVACGVWSHEMPLGCCAKLVSGQPMVRHLGCN